MRAYTLIFRYRDDAGELHESAEVIQAETQAAANAVGVALAHARAASEGGRYWFIRAQRRVEGVLAVM